MPDWDDTLIVGPKLKKPQYKGRNVAIHVEAWGPTTEIIPVGPKLSKPHYSGVGQGIFIDEQSPSLNDELITGPKYKKPQYYGRSRAIHVRGTPLDLILYTTVWVYIDETIDVGGPDGWYGNGVFTFISDMPPGSVYTDSQWATGDTDFTPSNVSGSIGTRYDSIGQQYREFQFRVFDPGLGINVPRPVTSCRLAGRFYPASHLTTLSGGYGNSGSFDHMDMTWNLWLYQRFPDANPPDGVGSEIQHPQPASRTLLTTGVGAITDDPDTNYPFDTGVFALPWGPSAYLQLYWEISSTQGEFLEANFPDGLGIIQERMSSSWQRKRAQQFLATYIERLEAFD